MNVYRMSCVTLALVSLGAALMIGPNEVRAFDEGYGNITGQFVFDGEAPEREVKIQKGDPEVKDAAVCSAETIYKEDLVVDPESKGIANIFVYIFYRDAAKLPVHPDLKESEEKEITFDQKNCVFIPHTMIVRTDQTVLVKSDDNVAHNTHTYTFRSNPVNFLIAPNDRKGVPVRKPMAESLPLPVKCDIHPWMEAYWLIVDHPYAAVTDEEGKFTIEKLPAGEHEFRVWHERAGYLDRNFKVTVTADETTEIEPVQVPPAEFDK